MTPRRSTRLSRDDWLAAGIKVLADRGADALKAEPLARHLQTTKGSFYWHFTDVPAFHEVLLTRWEETATDEMARLLEATHTPVARLRELAQAIAEPRWQPGAASVEASIRAWSTVNDTARAAVERVDAARLAQLRALLSETGIGNPEMASILHGAAIGMAMQGAGAETDRRAAIGSLVDLVLALR
ncbi:TetR family transcriptional regulator [Roseovarius salis]|uniref:TetR/AcrR family transcriptional regulator n=1 Tax=Roseovarius salis TaxID=3376063 RepID=UPI0037C6FE55